MEKIHKIITLLLLSIVTGLTFSSCSKADEPKEVTIVGEWNLSEKETNSDGTVTSELKMNLIFKSDRTGSIQEQWTVNSRAVSNETYVMNFSWSTATDSNGNDIMKISYMSGDKDTELFEGGENTVLWTRQYVLTGDILNVYGGDGVWVFRRK